MNSEIKQNNKKRLLIMCCVLAAVAVAVVLLYRAFFVARSEYHYSLDSLSGWKKYNYQAEHANNKDVTEFSVVDDEEKGRVVKIDSKSTNDARIYRTIRVEPLSYYKITVSFKYENVSSGAGANLSGYNMSGAAFKRTGTSETWERQSIYLETQENQKSINLSLGLGGYGSECSGTVYWDDLVITKVDSIPAETVTLKLTSTSSSSEKESNDVSIGFKILFLVVVLGALVYAVLATVRRDKTAEEGKISLEKGRFARADIIIVLVMTVVTAIMSFAYLGSFDGTPNTYWKAANNGEYIEISFTEEKTVSRFVYFSGIPSGSGKISVDYLDGDGNFVSAATLSNDDISFYKWAYKAVSFTAKTVRIYATTKGIWLNEVGFYENVNGEYVQIEVDTDTIKTEYEETSTSGRAEYLFDEQEDVRPERSLMDSTYFDEIYFPRTAYEQIHGLSIYERTHPPLGKVFMQLGIMIFGMNTFGWRFAGTFFGVLLVPLVYAFALKVFKKREWAITAGLLIMFDFMRLAQTRLATIDSYSCFFSVAMFYFMYDYFAVKSYEIGVKKSLKPLFLCGIMFGLGAASKWTCIYTGMGLAVIFFIIKGTEIYDAAKGRACGVVTDKSGNSVVKRYSFGDYFFENFVPTCLWCVLFFVIIPATIYVLSYIPYMASNPNKTLLQIVIDNQQYMYNYHSGLTATHSFGSKWYTWPIMVRPIWYYVGYNVPSGYRSTIVSMGNPAVWWIGVPCVFAGAIMAWKNKDKKMALFTIAYVAQYAPWILINRVCFIYHYFSASVFALFFVVYVLKTLFEMKIINKWVIWGYIFVVFVLFVMFYPVLTGIPVLTKYTEALRWFSSWYF